METFILKQLNEWKRYFQEENCKMRAEGPCVWQQILVGAWEMQGGRNLDVDEAQVAIVWLLDRAFQPPRLNLLRQLSIPCDGSDGVLWQRA